MHDEFVGLMIDIFNMHSYDSFLRQLIILLICRYHSERAEFIRNLHRTLLFFDKSDYNFCMWTRVQLEKFTFNSEKSNIWLLKIKNTINDLSEDIEEIEVNDELFELLNILSNLKRAVIYQCDIIDSEGELNLDYHKGERKINPYAQNLYRNLKVYDYMINFLFQNKELLTKVRSLGLQAELKPNQEKIVDMTKKIFKKIFRLLEVMTVNNPTTQELMWKYKESFVFEELGNNEQEGELELVLAIIDDSQDAVKYQQNKWTPSKTRQFVNLLNKRVHGKENFVIILEIYNKLIKFEAVSFLKHSLLKLIMKNMQQVHSAGQSTRREFEAALNLQEIIYSIINNQEMHYIRDFFKKQFPLTDLFKEIDASIDSLNTIANEDNTYDLQDYEELREYQYIDLLNIYAQLYLHPEYSENNRKEVSSILYNLAHKYIEKLNDMNSKADFDFNTGFKKSELKFLLIYMKIFLKKVNRYISSKHRLNEREAANKSKDLKESFFEDENDYGNLGREEAVKVKMTTIIQTCSEIEERLIESENSDIQDIMDLIHNNDEDGLALSISHTRDQTHRDNRPTNTLRSIRTAKPGSKSKTTNTRSQESSNYTNLWSNYIKVVIDSRESRKLIDQEQLGLAKLIFENLTSPTSNALMVQSYKTFISTSIDYVYSCEKANWTLYIIIFIFKVNSMVLKLCDQKISLRSDAVIKENINSNILDSIDTLRTSSMIFKILSSSKDDTFCYSNEIFSITAYFCNKLLQLRPASVQKKFLGFFKTDSTSQHFFMQCNEYLKVHMDKLNRNTLKAFYSRHSYTDELSETCYLIDKNLEKQVVALLKNF